MSGNYLCKIKMLSRYMKQESSRSYSQQAINFIFNEIKSQPQEQRILSENSPTPIREPSFYPSQIDYNYYMQYALICQMERIKEYIFTRR